MTTNWRDWLLVAIVLVACCMGCVGPGMTSVNRPTVYVDPSVPMADAIAGLDMWRASVGVDWVISPDRNANVGIVAVVDGCEEDGHKWAGYTDEGSTTACICVSALLSTDEASRLPAVIAHELGHVMHLGHLTEGAAIMHTFITSDSITDADIAAWRRIWGYLP